MSTTEPLTGMGAVMAAGGDAGLLMREIDWARTPVGPVATWPQSLCSAVSICLLSRFPMVVWWGPELVFIFNDAYRPVLGTKDPRRIMGSAGREVWPEIWPVIGPMLDGVLRRGEATWSDDQLLLLDRNGYREECYFTFSYSPVRDETGGVGGVFTAVTETTGRVVGERRLRTLSDLAESTSLVRTPEEVCARAAGALGRNPADIPFSRLYLLGDAGSAPVPVAFSGGDEGWLQGAAPPGPAAEAALNATLDGVAASGRAAPLALTPASGGQGPVQALVLPIAHPGRERPAGLLVAGLSPRRALDADYQRFFELVAGQVGTALADADAYLAERRRAEALADLDRAKTAFFSNISHEFRTPLTLLLGPLEQAMEGVAPEHRHELEVAHRNGMRLLRLVNSLLDFSRIEAGRIEASYEPVDLAALTADLASAFRSAAEAAGLRLVVDCPPLEEAAWVDVEMWEKVVLNLLSNAMKFTFEGTVEVRTRLAANAFELVVADTGVGIPEPELPRLFDRFHRVRGTRSRTHEGTGIGLALVHELVDLHGGSIAVSSRAGEGTAFTVSIPRGHAHLPAEHVGAARDTDATALGAAPFVEEARRWLSPAAPPPAGPAGADGEVRVLVVDDNADMRDYLTGLLAPHWTVEAVAHGAGALDAMAARLPDLVLVDVMMPGMDGFELLERLRSQSRTRHVPVVMLSARAGDEAKVEGLLAGADDYLVKPFVARELVARVRANLELSRMRVLARETLERYEEADRALHRALASVAAIVRHTRGDVALTELYGRLSRTVAELVGARRAAFWRLCGDEIRGQADAHGFEPELLDRMRLDVDRRGDGLLERIIFKGEVFNGRLDADERFARYREVLDALHAPDAVAVPWAAGGEALGVLAVYESTKPGGFSREDVWVVRIAALAAALVWEHKQARDELGEANEREALRLRDETTRLAELEEIKSEFLKVASHELRGPVSVLRGYVAMIRDGSLGDVPPPVASVLPVLTAKVEEMVLLIDQMLETARIDDQALRLALAPLDLRTVVAGAVETLAPGVPGSHELRLTLPDTPVTVSGDAQRLRTALANLVDNAVRFSPGGGVVEVRCSVRAASREAVVEVVDHGLGIAPEHLQHLFRLFGRIVTPENSHIPGTGLGLYLSGRLAQMHGGRVTVDSEPGRGSTFSLVLPLVHDGVPGRRAGPASPPGPPAVGQNGGRARVPER